MALSQSEWFAKLKSWVPTWFFELERKNVAIFQGYAKVFSEVQKELEATADESYITRADGTYLDAQGFERGINRLANESDVLYAPRVQNIISQTDRPDLLEIINALLAIGPAVIHESVTDSAYFGRNSFCSRYEYWSAFPMNAFLVITPMQSHPPYAFFARENFCSRSDFMGSDVSADSIYASVIAAINANKAFGVFYRIVEKSH